MTTCSSCHEKKSTLCRALDDLLKEANMTDEGRKHSYNVDDVLSTLSIHLLSSSLNHTANVLPHHPNQRSMVNAIFSEKELGNAIAFC